MKLAIDAQVMQGAFDLGIAAGSSGGSGLPSVESAPESPPAGSAQISGGLGPAGDLQLQLRSSSSGQLVVPLGDPAGSAGGSGPPGAPRGWPWLFALCRWVLDAVGLPDQTDTLIRMLRHMLQG